MDRLEMIESLVAYSQAITRAACGFSLDAQTLSEFREDYGKLSDEGLQALIANIP